MTKTITFASLFVLAAAGSATAGGKEGSIGAGAEFGLNGQTGGVSLNYDAGKFHVGGFLGFLDGDGANNTDYTLGGRFFYHIHSTAMSDFGLGGGIGFYSHDQAPPADRLSLLFFEPAFQIRAFITSNVALSFTAGITIGLVDAGGTSLGGPNLSVPGASGGLGAVNAAAGVHYYFF